MAGGSRVRGPDAASGSRHRVSRVRRDRRHPAGSAQHTRTRRCPKNARTPHRTHSTTQSAWICIARHKHCFAHCALLTPPTAAPLGAGGRIGTPRAGAHSTRRPRSPPAWISTPIQGLEGVMIKECNSAAAGAAGMDRRVAWRATALSRIDGCGRRRASRELAREPRAGARHQRAVHGMPACVLLSVVCSRGRGTRARMRISGNLALRGRATESERSESLTLEANEANDDQ